MDPLEWSVIKEFKGVLKGKVVFSNAVLRSLQSHWYLTKKEKAQFQSKHLMTDIKKGRVQSVAEFGGNIEFKFCLEEWQSKRRPLIAQILRHKSSGFEYLMNALLKEKRSNEHYVNKMKEALKKKEKKEKSNENQKQHQTPRVIEGDQIYPGLTKVVKGIPDNSKFEEENLQTLTEDLEIFRKTMDPEDKMTNLSLGQIHCELVKGNENVHRKMKFLKHKIQKQETEKRVYFEENRHLQRERDDLEKKILELHKELHKEGERARRREALMNIDTECSTNPATTNSVNVYNINAENVKINN